MKNFTLCFMICLFQFNLLAANENVKSHLPDLINEDLNFKVDIDRISTTNTLTTNFYKKGTCCWGFVKAFYEIGSQLLDGYRKHGWRGIFSELDGFDIFIEWLDGTVMDAIPNYLKNFLKAAVDLKANPHTGISLQTHFNVESMWEALFETLTESGLDFAINKLKKWFSNYMPDNIFNKRYKKNSSNRNIASNTQKPKAETNKGSVSVNANSNKVIKPKVQPQSKIQPSSKEDTSIGIKGIASNITAPLIKKAAKKVTKEECKEIILDESLSFLLGQVLHDDIEVVKESKVVETIKDAMNSKIRIRIKGEIYMEDNLLYYKDQLLYESDEKKGYYTYTVIVQYSKQIPNFHYEPVRVLDYRMLIGTLL
ncbi:MAG: hypothetical protein AAFO07_12585 [Bacteroidota bacterium]